MEQVATKGGWTLEGQNGGGVLPFHHPGLAEMAEEGRGCPWGAPSWHTELFNLPFGEGQHGICGEGGPWALSSCPSNGGWRGRPLHGPCCQEVGKRRRAGWAWCPACWPSWLRPKWRRGRGRVGVPSGWPHLTLPPLINELKMVMRVTSPRGRVGSAWLVSPEGVHNSD